ncbi:hypothetical protein ACFXG4_43480 [Nocardia sp. NPDC059246]|uniref:hypothetical protein n=1 Tax=unclassified Nocardia TaxID=2637762 RepID=UPI0036A44593
MADLEQELLTLADRLRSSHTLAQFRDIHGDVEALAEPVAALDPEQTGHEAVRRLYAYLDATSAAAVRDGAHALRREHGELERELLYTIDQFRRSDGGMELTIPQVAMFGLEERIQALEPGSAEQWMLARLYEYAHWQRCLANGRAHQRLTRSIRRTPRAAPQHAAETMPHRAPSIGKRRDNGIGM